MARLPRLVFPGVPVHVIQRGNNRTATFHSASDFERYRDTLFQASGRFRCAIHAYVFMPNHVHLLITPEDDHGPSCMMQAIGRRYVRYVNTRHHRTGTLWEGRFRSAVVDSDRYLFTCGRYIELNPVRARMVDDANQYGWSSHRHNAYGESDPLVTTHPLYDTLAVSPVNRQAVYRALFRNPLEQQQLDLIRKATNRGTALGDTPFLERMEAMIERLETRVAPRGGPRSVALHATR
jgi:putative transposase